MLEQCTCKAEEITILPCSGGSNCGQIANQAAVSLDTLGVGKIYCLAGIAAHIPGMVESTKSAKRLVAIDGCQVACAKKTIEHAGLKVTDWICVTDEGITKSHTFNLQQKDIDTISRKVKASLAKPTAVIN
jgi:uncharacterized metal-binding protein